MRTQLGILLPANLHSRTSGTLCAALSFAHAVAQRFSEAHKKKNKLFFFFTGPNVIVNSCINLLTLQWYLFDWIMATKYVKN